MSFIIDKYHKEQLENKKVNIKEYYLSNNKEIERNILENNNIDINKGILLKKEYYLNNELKLINNKFDTRIQYSFISNELVNEEKTCPNCGMVAKISDVCPYCGTNFNLDYQDKDLGSKYYYDLVLKDSKYRIITAIVDIIVSLILSFIFIKTTSRTFNSYDISKVFIYGLIASLILYYFFYIIDAYIILGPIKRYKEKENEKQRKFWEETKLDKKDFFNNLNYEISKYYYNNTNIIDYDILDYLEFKNYNKNNKLYITVKINIRLVELNNNKIKNKYINKEFTFRKNENESLKLNNGVNIIECHNCGASIDVTKGKCEYCDTPIKYLQSWIMVEK